MCFWLRWGIKKSTPFDVLDEVIFSLYFLSWKGKEPMRFPSQKKSMV